MSPTGGVPLITFLSDYGLQDEFVGVCHAVIARRCPHARMIDLTHAIPRHDVLAGALILRGTLELLPAAVHLAVVDPAVGSRARRALALRCGERMLVGPDNGLLMLAAEQLAGMLEAADIGGSPECLEPVRARSMAATSSRRSRLPLPQGSRSSCWASRSRPSPWFACRRRRPAPKAQPACARAAARHATATSTTDASADQLDALGSELVVRAGERAVRASRARTFADVPAGGLLLFEDGPGPAALAVNLGSAADLLGAGPGDELLLCPA